MSTATASLRTPYALAERQAINPWIIAVTVTLATFMELLDTAIANVALPHIAGGLAGQLRREHLGPDKLSGIELPSCFRFPRG